MLESISLRGLLSFGWERVTLPLTRLNVLIGPNASGKSNVLDALSLLAEIPRDPRKYLNSRGGGDQWMHRGPGGDGIAEIEVVAHSADWPRAVRYAAQLEVREGRLGFVTEQVLTQEGSLEATPFLFAVRGEQSANVKAFNPVGLRTPEQDPVYGAYRWLEMPIPVHNSMLMHSAPSLTPQMAALSQRLTETRVYTHWLFGPLAPLRTPQPADQPDDALDPVGTNLAMVLGRLRRDPVSWRQLLSTFRLAYEGLDDVEPLPQGGNTLMLFVREGDRQIPATRLSDGTLRWLFLATLLSDPQPAPLILLEEPEMGLHPDLIRKLAELLKEASERTQIVLTTHSVELVNQFSDQPESVVVCERSLQDGSTQLQRLEPDALSVWLQKYRLGEAWQAGALGGNRF